MFINYKSALIYAQAASAARATTLMGGAALADLAQSPSGDRVALTQAETLPRRENTFDFDTLTLSHQRLLNTTTLLTTSYSVVKITLTDDCP